MGALADNPWSDRISVGLAPLYVGSGIVLGQYSYP